MAHIRTQLREAVRDALGGHVTDVPASRVYLGRNYPIDIDAGPAIAVHAAAAQSVQAGPDDLDRTIEMSVVLMISGGADFEDRLDQMATDVEARLHVADDLHAICHDFWLDSEEVALEPDADARIARLGMTFMARVITPRGNPETRS